MNKLTLPSPDIRTERHVQCLHSKLLLSTVFLSFLIRRSALKISDLFFEKLLILIDSESRTNATSTVSATSEATKLHLLTRLLLRSSRLILTLWTATEIIEGEGKF